MQITIPTNDKKAFIQWFLNHYHLKKRESIWILNYLLNHMEILANIHFIRDAQFCPRGIIITSNCSDEVAFRFYKKHLVTMDADKAFHDIRLNPYEPLYIQLNFKNSNQNAYYATVLEENPYTPNDYFNQKEDQVYANSLLDHTLYHVQKEKLKEQIDESLDDSNQTKFNILTSELKELGMKYQNQPKR